jgi:branched-chain amino acid aminotransferase
MAPAETFAAKRARTETLDTIWLDGEFVDWDDAQVHVLAHGLHYGTTIFEGVRCYSTQDGPAIFRWDDHLDRFFQSARPYDMDIPYTRAELTAATAELIRSQDLDACYVRPIAMYGYERLGIDPEGVPIQVAIAVWPWDEYHGEAAADEGLDVTVSSWRRYSASQMPTTAKTGGTYVNSVLASLDATAQAADEALLLNKDGTVAEGPAENLFLVRDGDLYTPGLGEDVLPGITRESVLRVARDLGYTVHDDATISRGELFTADELFFTGTAVEVTPIRSVDGTTIGDGGTGPVTAVLRSRFEAVVEGRVDGYEAWHTPISEIE